MGIVCGNRFRCGFRKIYATRQTDFGVFFKDSAKPKLVFSVRSRCRQSRLSIFREADAQNLAI